MSAQAIGVPTGEQAVLQRIAALEAIISQAQAGVAPAPPPGGSQPSFASALQAATAGAATAGAATAAGQPAPLGQEGVGGGSGEYEGLIQAAAQRNGVDPAVLHGLIQQESGFDPNAQSGAGAMGLTQLMPGTASSLGVANPMNPAESIEGGARYLGQMLRQFGGNTTEALAAYNAGPGAVQQYGGVPPYSETQSYVSKVLGYAETYRQARGVPA